MIRQRFIKLQIMFIFFALLSSFVLFYKFNDEKLSPRALSLLVEDGHEDRALRKDLHRAQFPVRLPKDSIFDHQQQVLTIENQFTEFKKQIELLKKDNTKKTELSNLLKSQIESSIESLYSINPLKLMDLNLKILSYCLLVINEHSLSLSQELKVRITALDFDSVFLRACRFHVQSILGSIDVLQRSQFFINPSVYFIRKQRLTNHLANISLDTNFKISELKNEHSWNKVRELELIYAHFFKQLIYDPQVDIKSQISEVYNRLLRI